jgi:hypothetical protein
MPPTPPRRRRGNVVTTGDAPRSFKDRMASAKTLAEAADDGYIEVVRDDRLDYCGLPMLLNKWQTKSSDTTYNDRTHARVWAEVEAPDKPEPVRIRFWDYGGELGDQLLEFERCGTRGNVAVMLDAREYDFDGGVGYAFSFIPIPDEDDSVPPPAEDNPTY